MYVPASAIAYIGIRVHFVTLSSLKYWRNYEKKGCAITEIGNYFGDLHSISRFFAVLRVDCMGTDAIIYAWKICGKQLFFFISTRSLKRFRASRVTQSIFCPHLSLPSTNYTQEKLHSVHPANGMTYKQVETLPGRIRAISPATNPVRQKATDVVKRGK